MNKNHIGWRLEATWFVAVAAVLGGEWLFTHHNRVIDFEKNNPRTRIVRITECRNFEAKYFHVSQVKVIMRKWERYQRERSYHIKFILAIANVIPPSTQDYLAELQRDGYDIHVYSFGQRPRTLQGAFRMGIRAQHAIARWLDREGLILNTEEHRRLNGLRRLSYEQRLHSVYAKYAMMFLDNFRDVFFWKVGKGGILEWDAKAVREWERFTEMVLGKWMNKEVSKQDYLSMKAIVEGKPKPIYEPVKPKKKWDLESFFE